MYFDTVARDDDWVLGAADWRHGMMRSRDLARIGISRTQVRRLVDKGLLAPVRPGVVLLGGGTPSDWQHAVAAWMMAGPEAALSHSTAARAHLLRLRRLVRANRHIDSPFSSSGGTRVFDPPGPVG